jgi:hypothetical protein
MSTYDDDDRPEIPEHFRQQADGLLEGTEKLDDAMRQLGLYVEGTQLITIDTPTGPQPALAANMMIGDVAYSDRVQHPEKYGVDQQFRIMEREMTGSQFDDIKERMKRNVAAGRDPMDDGDDEL